MQPEWLLAIALAVSLTFILASPLNDAAARLQVRWAPFLSGFESKLRHPEEAEITPPDADVVVVGMGRVGEGAYEVLQSAARVLGIDRDPDVIERHRAAGRRVMLGDPSDPDFWERLSEEGRVAKTVVLAMDVHASNLYVAREIRKTKDTMLIAATARHEDERVELEEAGANRVRNFYGEAGNGLGDEALEMYRGAGF